LAAPTFLEGPAIEWFEETNAKRDNSIVAVFVSYNQFIKHVIVIFRKMDEKVMVT
jgi:hypothetical protein